MKEEQEDAVVDWQREWQRSNFSSSSPHDAGSFFGFDSHQVLRDPFFVLCHYLKSNYHSSASGRPISAETFLRGSWSGEEEEEVP